MGELLPCRCVYPDKCFCPPNADLIGFKFVTAEGTPAEEEIEVVGTCEWSDQYVTVRFPTGHETIKPVAVVRRRKEIDGG